jgi:hypothetical protein
MITKYARPNIVDSLLMVIVMMGQQSFWNGEVTVFHPFVHTKAANKSVIHNREEINFHLPDLQYQKSFTLS